MAKKLITMNDVAKKAGVSQSAVSLILNGRADVSFSPETVERVLAAAKELGYRTRMPSASKGSAAHSILVISANLGNPYYAVSTQSIEREARKHNLNVLTCNTYHMQDMEATYLRMAETMNFSGIIYLYPPENQEEFSRVSKKIHTICICDRTTQIDSDVIELDNFKSGQLATAHLLSLGHKSIAFLTNTVDGSDNHTARYNGILSQMEEAGLGDKFSLCLTKDCPADRMSMSRYDYQIGYLLAQNKQIYSKNVTGLICMNDTVAFGAIDALHEKGYRVPDDFSVIGFDNTFYSGLSGISLTTVDHHIDLFSQTTVNFLLQRLNRQGESADDGTFVRFKFECRPNLIIRNSTAAPRGKQDA